MNYPAWICEDYGVKYGNRPTGNSYGATWHIDVCGVCGTKTECTEPRDYGHLKNDWNKMLKALEEK